MYSDATKVEEEKKMRSQGEEEKKRGHKQKEAKQAEATTTKDRSTR